MDPDTPFSVPVDPPDAVEGPGASAPPVPDSDGPEEPRLGILHFMVWTACVAAYLGLARVLTFPPSDRIPVPFMAAWAMHATGAGAALGGLGLLAARRWRGLPFPVHPGEYLLVVLGFGSVLGLAARATLRLALAREEAEFFNSGYFLLWHLVDFAFPFVYALIFLWPLVRVKIPRWRWFFGTLIAGHFIRQLMFCGGPTLGNVASKVLFCGVVLLLVTVVLWDHFQGKRYPWTHWAGVFVSLWFDGLAIGWSVWRLFS